MARFEGYLLNELFDTKVKVKKITDRRDEIIYKFSIEDKVYNVIMVKAAPIAHIWEIIFTLDRLKGKTVEDEKTMLGITGTGDAIEVFSGVIKTVKMWTKEKKPEIFGFSAKEPSRKKLYVKFAKSIDKAIPGYKYTGVEEDVFSEEPMYTFERRK